MTKRSRADSSEEEGEVISSPPRKRPKSTVQDSTEAVSLLLQHSDGLVACLTSLRSSGRHVSPAQLDQLSVMSKVLLPAFKFLRHRKTGASGEGRGENNVPQPTQTQGNEIPPLAAKQQSSLLPP